MPVAPGSIVRTLSTGKRTIRPLALVALAAPLALGACVAQNDMKSSALAAKPRPATPNGGPDAYGYAPARLAALADGERIALPSSRPDLAKLQASEAQTGTAGTTVASSAPATTSAPAAATSAPETELAALKADVDERRATLIVIGEGKTQRVAVTAPVAAPREPKPTVLATAQKFVDPRKSVPAAISVVAQSADAVKVAAIDTTSKAIATTSRAFDAVQSRIGDTFKGADTITGSTAMDRMIEQAAAANNIPTELAYAVVRVESHYNPTAIGGGAYGLSQIKPATARGLGFEGSASGLLNPETNLRYGMKYLAGAWEKSGHDICGTAMRYKGGHRTTVMTRSAATYCANVKRHMAAIQRRRAPAADRDVLVASAEPRKISVATERPGIHSTRVSVPASAGAIPVLLPAAGKPVDTQPTATVASVAVPVPTPAKSGRVRVFSDGETPSDGRYGYAEQ